MKKDYKIDWRKRARKLLAEAFGNQCTICGYNKTTAAFDYHHIDAKTKDKQLSTAMKNGYAWSKIVIEARKCTLVCCRCHRELHEGITNLPQNYATFNEEYADLSKLRDKKYKDFCPICLSLKRKNRSFCSLKCFAKTQQKFNPSKEELSLLITIKPFTSIAKDFGVSDNAIRKRCKLLEIPIPAFPKGYWLKSRG